MSIKWNKVTWYSKLGALVVLIVTVSMGVYFWKEYQEIQTLRVIEISERNILSSAEDFRENIFSLYGFRDAAAEFIRSNSSILVKNLQDVCGGGGWIPTEKRVELNCAQHEAAMHELSHVWWHAYRIQYPEIKKDLARDAVRLANLDVQENPQYQEVIEFARGYVYGIGEWQGMYCNNNKCVVDVQNILESEFGRDDDDTGLSSQVNDWEIYAGFSSYTMGKFKDGPHELPVFMWIYFEPEFTGIIFDAAYYEGGHP